MKQILHAILCMPRVGGALRCRAQTSDDLQWLEDPHGERALNWAREATARARIQLSALPSHTAIAEELKTTLARAPAEAEQLPSMEDRARCGRATETRRSAVPVAK